MKLTISKEDLYNDYVVVGMSTRDIANKYSTAQTNVIRMMKHYDIPARKPHERTEYFQNKMKPLWEEFKTYNKKWKSKECEWCKKEFEINYENKDNKFCSPECLKAYRKSQRTKYFCEECGKEIESKDRNYKKKYCEDCFLKYKSTPKERKVATNCGYCGKELFVIQSRFEANKYCYCDTKCMAKHYAEIYVGENSPTWTGGKKHYTGGWLIARDNTRERDNYSCQICGITEQEYGQQMSVHHIKKYKSFEDKVEANNLSNLVCLCEPCHRFVHSKQNTDKVWVVE